jgi:RecB family endonuclease NucS
MDRRAFKLLEEKTQMFDVFTTVRIRVSSIDANKAESLVLTLLENHLADMLENASVIETGIALSSENPISVGIQDREEIE